MDGLTISTSQSLLDTGRTASQLKDAQLKSQLKNTAGQADGKSFAQSLNEAVNNVNQLQKEADFKMQQLATGKAKSIPDVMIATEKADVAFKLMVQVRNKIIDAYKEIMKMQV